MPDDQSQATSTGGAGSDDSTLQIPEELRAKFPDLIEYILSSESMNQEERQYWIDMLPVMDENQVQQLKEILENERTQLASIDAKYAEEMNKISEKRSIADMATERKKKHDEIASQEDEDRNQDAKQAEQLLKEMEGS